MPSVIQNKGTCWIAGMAWKIVESGKRGAARRLARSADADHFITLPGPDGLLTGTANLSLSGLNPGQARRARAAAGALLPALGENGWAVFRLDESTLYFLAADGVRLSLMSDIAGSEAEIRKALARWQAWTDGTATRAVYSPAGFMPGTGVPEGDIYALLDEAGAKVARLRPVSTRGPLLLWTSLLVLAGLAWYGWSFWQQVQADRDNEARRQALLQAQRLIKVDPPKPWLTQPRPADFIAACRAGWDVPLSLAGWPLQAAECAADKEGHFIRLAWSRPAGATLTPFSERVQGLWPGRLPFFNIPGDASTGGVRLPLAPALNTVVSEPVGSGEEITRRLTNYALQIGATLSLREESAASLVVEGSALALPWDTWSFRLVTDVPPHNLFGPDVNTSGIRVTGINMNLNNARLTYSLEGVLYAIP